jgi:hypothetical protein
MMAPTTLDSIDTGDTCESEADTTAALHWQPLRLEKMADRRRHALELVRQCVPVSLMMPSVQFRKGEKTRRMSSVV